MNAPAPARIFISYATKDGAEYSARLRRELEAQGFSIWQDIVALQGNADWWSQIEAALRSKDLHHFILVVTPGALASHVVRREIRLAKQEGKTVSPVRGPDLEDLSKMPRWIGNLYDLDVPERRTNLIRVLEAPSTAKRVPMMAPEPPPDFVPRPREFDALKSQLLDLGTKDAVAITAALRGAGGYGKTTLAKALAHDPDIQDAYFDGVLWVELGEQGGGRVLALISDLVALVTGEARTMTTIEAARTALGEALGDRRILLVIDDVWKQGHLEPFLHGGSNTTRLVTTRFDNELPVDAVRQAVDGMQASEALTLIGWGLPADQVAANKAALAHLTDYLGEWAQLLKLANGFLRDRVIKSRSSLESAIADVNRRLEARGFTAFDDRKAKDYGARHHSVAAMMNTSLELLDKDQRERFGELGIFPEDADIPIGIVARLWNETGGLDDIDTEDLLAECLNLSLLLNLDMERRTIRFHDTTRHFLQDQTGKAGLIAQHKRLIQSMGDIGGAAEVPAADADYFYRYLPSHLADAGDREMLDALLLDPGWLQAKLDATSSPQALVADYEKYGQGQMQNFIGRTLRLSAGICARDKRQLLPQILGRLMACRDPCAPEFLKRARSLIKPPAVLLRHLSLTPPGAENSRFEGHTSEVNALAVLPDGRLASGAGWNSNDNTIRFWDLATGAETSCLEGHTDKVNALAVLPDGRLASGSYDNTIRLWDVKSGAETARLEPYTSALAVLPDGRLASGSYDNTIRLWDVKSGAETARLEGDTSALAVLPDGRLASGCYDNTIRLWDVKSGAETARLEGHTGWVAALAVLPDERLASGSLDNTIRLWDLATGSETARLEGHTGKVNAVTMVPDGRIASGSFDRTIRLWDLTTGTDDTRLEGRTGKVNALAVLPAIDDEVWGLASGSDDNTIRLWDLATGGETARLEGHTGPVSALAVLPDGRLASASWDGAISLWDTTTGAETTRLEDHTGQIFVLTVLPDGRLASGSWDHTIRLWDVATGAETARLDYTGHVNSLVVLPDGRLALGSQDPLGSQDHPIELWDATQGAETTRLEGHTSAVSTLAVLRDGRLAWGSPDYTIRLWDTATGTETALLEGHTHLVNSLVVLPDGRLASGSWDHTIRLWDPASGSELVRLELDGGVLCLAVLPDGGIVAGDEMGRLHWLEILG